MTPTSHRLLKGPAHRLVRRHPSAKTRRRVRRVCYVLMAIAALVVAARVGAIFTAHLCTG